MAGDFCFAESDAEDIPALDSGGAIVTVIIGALALELADLLALALELALLDTAAVSRR